MRQVFTFLRRGVAVAAAFAVAIPPAFATTAGTPVQTAQVADCPADFQAYGPGNEIVCACPVFAAGGVLFAPDGRVWGTATYTNDSSVCAAAQHAGIGGTIRVRGHDGCGSYRGSQRNGVATESYGAWGGSFHFPDVTPARCDQNFEVAQALPACPANLMGRPIGTRVDCTCPADAGGTVWGTGPYTHDSALCAAARHAGVIGRAGGTVAAVTAAGCDRYESGTANGIAAEAYGPWEASVYFPSAGSAACPAAPARTTFSIHFVGLQVLSRANRFFVEDSDAVLGSAFVVEEDGFAREVHMLPDDEDFYEGLRQGAVREGNVMVWRGPAQSVDLYVMLYKYDPLLPGLMRVLIGASTAISGALIAVGSGGAGAAAGAGVAVAGQEVASIVQDALSDDTMALGTFIQPLDLVGYGSPDGLQTYNTGSIWYHFATEHRDNGAHYLLFWQLR